MYKKLKDVLQNKENNFMMPFYWQHGDHYETIPQEIESIYNSGCRAFCVESRPHKGFVDEPWWRDMDLILSEASKRNMDVWLLDDDHFPTGHAVGHISKYHPEKARWDIGERHVDVLGPVNGALLLTDERETAKLLGIFAYKRTGEGENCDAAEMLDFSDRKNDRFVEISLPEGMWRVFFIYKIQEKQEFSDYIDMMSEDSVRVLIDAVYEPHFEHYKEYFGNTFKGFFSDEPHLSNTWFSSHSEDPGMYERRLGLLGMAYPWHKNVFLRMENELGFSPLPFIAAIWTDIGEKTAKVRLAYMNAVTTLYRDNFTRQLGGWCKDHGVEYIGHVIEDAGVHKRTGYGTGHYFRALDGQHMSGIDIVLHQIMPGMSNYIHTSSAFGNNADPEFFDYALCKMASSLAHISRSMKGRAMCEVFGAYGWAESGSEMKWLLDHLLVRGVNHFVPHAFSPSFPDPDCPPHFGAGGKDPQFKAFSRLMTYGNKVSHLLYGGKHVADAAILYDAELEWINERGKAQHMQTAAKLLYDNNIDFDFLPIDCIVGECDADIYFAEVEDGVLKVGENTYKALIIPEAEILPDNLENKLKELEANGVSIIYIGKTCKKEELIAKLNGKFTPDVEVFGYREFLRSTHYVDGANDIYMFVNESTVKPASVRIVLNNLQSEKGVCLNLLNDEVYKVNAQGGEISLELAPYESCIFVFGEDNDGFSNKKEIYKEIIPGFDFKVEIANADDMESFALFAEAVKNGEPINITTLSNLPDFSGIIRYTASFSGADLLGKSVGLDLGDCGNVAEVYLNGKHLGLRLCKPYVFDFKDNLLEENELVIEVSNTLANKIRDDFSKFMVLKKAGLHEGVRLIYKD